MYTIVTRPYIVLTTMQVRRCVQRSSFTCTQSACTALPSIWRTVLCIWVGCEHLQTTHRQSRPKTLQTPWLSPSQPSRHLSRTTSCPLCACLTPAQEMRSRFLTQVRTNSEFTGQFPQNRPSIDIT